MVTIRSRSEIKLERTFNKVVLPAPVPPETIMLSLAFTELLSKSNIGGVIVRVASSCSTPIGIRPKRRIDMMGPSRASGGITTLTREPSSSRASHIGDDSSTRLPTFDTILSMMCRRCAASLNTTLVSSRMPPRSM